MRAGSRRWLLVLTLVLLVAVTTAVTTALAGTAGAAGPTPPAPGPVTRTTATDPVVGRDPYPGNPESEPARVAAEDDRLVEMRTVDSLAHWSKTPLKAPYRLATGSTYTLVLTARQAPYTVADLLTLAPQTFVRQPDGAFLLSESIIVQAGATLRLSATGGLRLLMASDHDGFVSLVNYGGRLEVVGTKVAPVEVQSFDRTTLRPDRLTDDGRAYLRSIGGFVAIAHAHLHDLGFWSGRTGGLALTGTDRPDSGSLEEVGKSLQVSRRTVQQRAAAAAGRPRRSVTVTKGLRRPGRSPLNNVLPAGPLPVPTVDVDNPRYSFVSASIADTRVDGNAFGLFVSSSNGLDVRDSAFDHNLVDGVVLHRYVANAVIAATHADDNGGDGFLLARATTGIVLSQVTAQRNSRNGVTMSGLPLANGPNATGTSIGSYGDNSLSHSDLTENGRYGVEVIGGVNVGVLSNDVAGNDDGVVVRGQAERVSIVGNRVDRSVGQGIALRDGVRDAAVTGNTVSGGATGVYLRNAVATVRRNTLTDFSMHAITLVGALGASVAVDNTIAGRGPSAIDTKRAVDLDTGDWSNDMQGWSDTTPFLVTLKRFLQPLTLMWLVLACLLVFTAVRGSTARRRRAHPYADKRPVSDGRALTAPPYQSAGVR